MGSLGIDNIDALYNIAGNDNVLKEIGDTVKRYSNDDNLVYMYDAEKAMKMAYVYDLRHEVKAAVEKVKGNEIALEVDENLPFKANGSLKVSECNNPIEITCYADAEELGKTGATTTAYIVFDKNGEVISVESGETTDNCFNSYTKNIKVTFRLQPYNATRYANVGKVAIILQDSEAYKKAADQLKALQEDFISKKQK